MPPRSFLDTVFPGERRRSMKISPSDFPRGNSITTRKLRVEGRGRNFMVSMAGFVPVIMKEMAGFSA